MDPEARQSALLPTSSLILLIVGIGGWLLYEQPLTSLRPVTPKAFERGNNGSQDVEARLWQDPFRPVYEHRKRFAGREKTPEVQGHLREHELLALARQIQGALTMGEEPLPVRLILMPVLLPGGPYAEAAETRRRTRKAVLAGLSVAGYVPEWDEWIGYFEAPLPKVGGGSRTRTVIPYEWFQKDPLDQSLSENENDLRRRPEAPSVLVLWVDENDFPKAGLWRIARLLGDLLSHRSADLASSTEEVEARLKLVRIALLGPASSTTLLTMLEEDKSNYLRNPQVQDRNDLANELADLLTYITQDYLDCGLDPCREGSSSGTDELPLDAGKRFKEVQTSLVNFLLSRISEVSGKFDLRLNRWQLSEKLEGLLQVNDSDRHWPRNVIGQWRETIKELQEIKILQELEVRLSEEKDWLESVDVKKVLKRVEIFSSRSTADEERILEILRKRSALRGATLPEVVTNASGGAQFHRTVVSDEKLAKVLVEELALRGVRPTDTDSGDHVVLISEWDTFYGRTLPRTFLKALKSKMDKGCQGNHIGNCKTFHKEHLEGMVHQYSYLRGMDGNTPSRSEEGNKAREIREDGNDTSPLFGSELLTVNPEELERPMGPGQLDDMRRLAQKIERLSRGLARKKKGEIRAIGVLGSDVYDKQLVLQALQRRFPRALFFTTDLDARLLHPSEYSWNRNLLIASSFGLELSEKLQRDVPPFRDSYQTAAFLATLLALDGSRERQGSLWRECSQEKKDGSEDVRLSYTINQADQSGSQVRDIESCLTPRLFEIGRTGAFPLSLPELAVSEAGRDLLHPPTGRESGWGGEGGQFLLGLTLSVALAVILVAPINSNAYSFVFPRNEAEHRLRRTVLWALAVSAIAFGALAVAVHHDSTHANGEPFLLWNGISLWPTEILRLLAFGLSVFFLGASVHRLRSSQEDLADTYGLPRCSPAESPGLRARWWKVHRWIARLDRWRSTYGIEPSLGTRVCREIVLLRRLRRWLSIHHWQTSTRRDRQGTMDAQYIWRRYCTLARPGHRAIRFIPWALLYLFFSSFIVLMRRPNRPVRGDWSSAADWGALTLGVLGLTALTFFVVDATRLCQSFIHALADRRTRWPSEARKRVADKREMRLEDMDDYLDMEIIADRSEAVGRLILYPFIVLFVMILSRSSFFDRWDWPFSLVLIMGALAALAAWCALALRRAAEEARTKAVGRIRSRLARALSRGPWEAPRVAQLRLLIEEVHGLHRGAFAHWSRHPVLKAILIPFGGVGLLALVEILGAMGL